MKTTISLCYFALAVLATGAELKPTPLTGTWRITEVKTTGPKARTNSNPQPGLYIFTGEYFSAMAVYSESPRPDVIIRPKDFATASAADLLAAWGGFSGYCGTYSISGETVSFKAVVSMQPRPMTRGEAIVYSFRMEGNKLTLVPLRDANGPIANGATIALTRIE
jgi:hypothetical protein